MLPCKPCHKPWKRMAPKQHVAHAPGHCRCNANHLTQHVFDRLAGFAGGLGHEGVGNDRNGVVVIGQQAPDYSLGNGPAHKPQSRHHSRNG